jgi:hypothetical protein
MRATCALFILLAGCATVKVTHPSGATANKPRSAAVLEIAALFDGRLAGSQHEELMRGCLRALLTEGVTPMEGWWLNRQFDSVELQRAVRGPGFYAGFRRLVPAEAFIVGMATLTRESHRVSTLDLHLIDSSTGTEVTTVAIDFADGADAEAAGLLGCRAAILGHGS